jgi:hypothetical protein
MFDIEDEASCQRIPCHPYIEELRRWQRLLDTPEQIEPDGDGSGPGRVQLRELRQHARRWEQETAGSQHVGPAPAPPTTGRS